MAVAIAILGCGTAAAQAPASVSLDDVLAMEAFGPASLSPDGRWAVFSTRGPWDQAPVYDGEETTTARLSRLTILRTEDPGTPIVLASADHSEGYAAGPFSPDSRYLVVTAVSPDTYRMGILSLATGEVRWMPITPELPRLGQTVAWASQRRLLVAARGLDDFPVRWAVGSVAQARIPALWSRTVAGAAGVTVAYSGARRDTRPRPPGAGLVEIDAESGAIRRLVEGEVFDLAPSPDGRAIAALLEGRDLQISPTEPAVTGNPVRRRHLLLLRSDGAGPIEPYPQLEFASHLLSWSTDSQHLLTFARLGSQAFEDGGFYLISAEGQTRLDLGPDRPWVDRSDQGLPVARAAFLGEDVWLQVRTADGRRVWRTKEGSRRVPVLENRERLVRRDDGDWIVRSSGLVRLDWQGVRVGRLLRPDGEADPSNRAALTDGTRQASGGFFGPDRCLAVATGPAVCLGPDDVPLAAADDRVVIGRTRSTGGAASLVLASPGRRHTLATVNADLETRDWGRLEEIRPSSGDAAPSGWLLRPSRVEPGTRPPLVILMYPGAVHRRPPSWMLPGSDRTHISATALVAAGYAVLAPSLPVPGDGPVEAETLTAQLDAILVAVDAGGLADVERAALVGHSFGAYGALLVGTRTQRFRAIIATNGYSDLSRSLELPLPTRMLPESGPWYLLHAGWGETGQAKLGASLSRAPEDWVARSPIYAARNLATPTLLIESDLDGARMGALFGLLYRDNREAALVTYFGEGHVYASPGNLRDMHERILDWLDRYVRPEQPVDPARPLAGPGLEPAPDQEAVAGRVADQAIQ